jgi:siroheme synthase-like protein
LLSPQRKRFSEKLSQISGAKGRGWRFENDCIKERVDMIYRYPMARKKTNSIAYFPAFLNILGKQCLVVGGGNVALRKVRMLLECGAKVTVISSTLLQDLAQLAKKKSITVMRRNYKPVDLKRAVLVVAATDVKEVNRKVANEAKERGILVNVVDDPEPSDFIVPSTIRRGELTVAISTAGKSPALAKKIRRNLERSLGKEYAALVSLIEEVRSSLKQQRIPVKAEAWQEALNLGLLTRLVRAGEKKKAKDVLMRRLKRKTQ